MKKLFTKTKKTAEQAISKMDPAELKVAARFAAMGPEHRSVIKSVTESKILVAEDSLAASKHEIVRTGILSIMAPIATACAINTIDEDNSNKNARLSVGCLGTALTIMAITEFGEAYLNTKKAKQDAESWKRVSKAYEAMVAAKTVVDYMTDEENEEKASETVEENPEVNKTEEKKEDNQNG